MFYIIVRKLKLCLINSIASSFIIPSKIRVFIYRVCGMDVDTSAFIHPYCNFNGTNMRIGKSVFMNFNCVFENIEYIEIGNNSSLGMEVMLCTAAHEFGTMGEGRMGKLIGKPIIIGKSVWLGSRVTVLPGVKIGDGCVIGAGSLVTKDCEPNGLYIGVPAKRVREID